MTTVRHIASAESIRARVAGQVRAELSRARVRPAHLPHLIGGSQSYWSRRVNGEQPLDVDDLEALAALLGCDPADFLRSSAPTGPGPWAPRGSNPQPTDYKLAPCAQILSFPPRHAPAAAA